MVDVKLTMSWQAVDEILDWVGGFMAIGLP